MTEDAGHQVKATKRAKWVENELMTQFLCNKLSQESRCDWMMSEGDQAMSEDTWYNKRGNRMQQFKQQTPTQASTPADEHTEERNDCWGVVEW